MTASRAASVYADFLLPHVSAESVVVDVGCGDGELTVDLATSVGEIVGVDTDAEVLDQAQARAEQVGARNATFVIGDTCALGLTDGAADAVLAHSVLEALEQPLDALREMRRVLRPGGVVAVASVEYGGLILAGPHQELLQRFYAIRAQLWRLEGADPHLGRHLRGLVIESGFVEVEATTKAISYGTPDLVASFGRGRAEDSADDWYVYAAIRENLSTRKELSAIREAWLTWAESPLSYAAFTWCRALGWKR